MFADTSTSSIVPNTNYFEYIADDSGNILMYDISCPGSQAYASLAGEIINQEKYLK